MKSIQVIEDGDIYLGIEAFFEKEHSKARIEYRIYKNNDDVDVNVTLFFNDMNKMVKLAIPVSNAGKVIGQTAFGTDTLFDDGREMISHRFTAVESGKKFVAVFDKSRYGGHFEDGTLYLSLVRGTTYCAHPIEDRMLIPDDRYTKKMDQGEHNYFFRLSVCDEIELDRKANEFNRKPYAVNVFPLGEKDKEDNFTVSVSNKNISLVAMKKSDKRDGYILRLINNYKDAQETSITVGDVTQNYAFGKYEVKTFFYDGQLHELDLMEI
jgi:alpha-mannosidase